MLESVARTRRAVVVHQAVARGGFGAELTTILQRELWDSLAGPVLRVAGADTPVPYAKVARAAAPSLGRRHRRRLPSRLRPPMSEEVRIPRLGMTATEATLVAWSVASGGHVEVGDVIAVLETDKVETELEATMAGRFVPAADPGTVHEVGAVIAEIVP